MVMLSMGLFDGISFGKKKDDSLGMPQMNDAALGPQFQSPQDPLAMQQPQNFGSPAPYQNPQQFAQPSFQQGPLYGQSSGVESMQSSSSSRDIELLRAKMDAIQATLDSMNQRFANIERFINETAKKRW